MGTNRFIYYLTKYKIHHILFWLFYFGFWYFTYKPVSGASNAYINALITIAVSALASYLNNYLLFPEFLKKRYYWQYLTALFLTVSFSSLLQILLLMLANTIDDNDKSSLWSIGFYFNSAISISYTSAITMSLKLFKQWYEKERLATHFEKLQIETELKYLKSQINPHFLFNCLNSIYALTLTKNEKAPEMVLKLSSTLRYILYDGMEKTVTLAQEINHLENYLEIEKIRFGDKININFNVIGDVKSVNITPMLFVPFIENAFKHGVNSTIQQSNIDIKFEINNQILFFEIINSLPSHKVQKSIDYKGGIGIQNVRKRLQIMYPDSHTLNTTETESEYCVNLKIAFSKTQNQI